MVLLRSRRATSSLLLLSLLTCFQATFAQGLIESTEQIARQLAATISNAGYRSVAVVDPLTPNDEASAFGRFLAEELSGALVNSGQLRVIDRLSLQRILDEQRLSVSGLVNDASAVQRIGDLAGVEVLVLGTYFVLGDHVRLSLKGLNVQTAESVAAVNSSLPLDANVRSLLGHGLGNVASSPQSTPEAPEGRRISYSANVTHDPASGSYFVYDLCSSPAWIEISSGHPYSSVAFTLSPNSAMNGRALVYVGSRLAHETLHGGNYGSGSSRDTTVRANVGPNAASNSVRIELARYRSRDYYDWHCTGVFTLRSVTID